FRSGEELSRDPQGVDGVRHPVEREAGGRLCQQVRADRLRGGGEATGGEPRSRGSPHLRRDGPGALEAGRSGGAGASRVRAGGGGERRTRRVELGTGGGMGRGDFGTVGVVNIPPPETADDPGRGG